MNSVTQIKVLSLGAILFGSVACADLRAQTLDTPMSRMRPIGSTRVANQLQRAQPSTRTAEWRETDFRSPVRQTAMMQQGGLTAPPLSNTGENAGLPITPGAVPTPGTALPPNPPTSLPTTGSDLRPMPQPQLDNQFATVDNSNLVTPASGYSAAFSQGCNGQSFVVPQSYATTQPLNYNAPPAQIAAPAILPGTAPGARLGAPMRSLLTFGQERNQVLVGQGILGQPTAYVPGQPMRNWLRYLTP